MQKLQTKVETKKVSEYQKKVLNVNKKLKEEQKSLGGAIRTIYNFRNEIDLPASFQRTTKLALSKTENGKKAMSAIKRNCTFIAKYKNGKIVKKDGVIQRTNLTTAFYVLLALYKLEKVEAKTVVKA